MWCSLCGAAVGISAWFLAVLFRFLCVFYSSLFFFCRHIVYYAKREMQYFLLRRYVADKNIYNLAAAVSLQRATVEPPAPKKTPPQWGHHTAAAAIETEAIKGSALHKKRRPHTIRLSSKAATSIFECFIYCKIDMAFCPPTTHLPSHFSLRA